MKLLGAVLIVIGLIGLIYGGVSYTRKHTVLDAGPVEITTDKHEQVPIPPIAGGIMVIAGLVIVTRS